MYNMLCQLKLIREGNDIRDAQEVFEPHIRYYQVNFSSRVTCQKEALCYLYLPEKTDSCRLLSAYGNLTVCS